MKKYKILFTILVLFLFSTSVYALEPDHESSFFKQNENGEDIEDAVFVQKRLDGVEIKEITAEAYGNIDTGGNGDLQDSLVNKSYKVVPLKTSILTVSSSNKPIVYNYYYFLDNLDEVLALLTDEQRSIVDSIKTVDDYERIKNTINNDVLKNSYCEGKEEYIEALKKSKGIRSYVSFGSDNTVGKSNGNTVRRLQSTDNLEYDQIELFIKTFTFIEEVYTPKGYEKETIVVPMQVYLLYNVESDGSLSLNGHSASQYGTLSKYNKNIDYTKYYDYFAKMKQEYLYSNDCGIAPVLDRDFSCQSEPQSFDTKSPFTPNKTYMNYNDKPVIKKLQSDDCYGYSVVVDKTSTEDISSKLSINTFVNGKASLSTSRDTEVTISVVINNDARRPSYENTIVSSLPKGFEYVEDSTNFGGVFNEANNTITWNLNYLDAMDSEELLYKVKVPKDADTTLDYKSSASISADGIDEPVKSRVVTVNLGSKDKNPKTGDFRELIVLSILSVCGVVMLVILNKNSIKGI